MNTRDQANRVWAALRHHTNTNLPIGIDELARALGAADKTVTCWVCKGSGLKNEPTSWDEQLSCMVCDGSGYTLNAEPA